jgi:predicted alpha/beta superfamily hydrolase
MAQNTNPEPQKNIVILGGSYGGVSTASISFKAQQQSLTTPIELSPSLAWS